MSNWVRALGPEHIRAVQQAIGRYLHVEATFSLHLDLQVLRGLPHSLRRIELILLDCDSVRHHETRFDRKALALCPRRLVLPV